MSVDFSQLPKPNFVDEIDYEQILAERNAYLISLYPVEEQEAINSGKTIQEFAQSRAELWKKGLEQDFQDISRIEKLKNSADYTIYTPGSDAGVQVSILSSFKAPSKEVLEDNEPLASTTPALPF